MSHTVTITGFVTDSGGASSPFNAVATVVDAPVISAVDVNPASAPAGTTRTITITASDPQGQTLAYTCLVNGVAATPTATPGVFTAVV